MTLDRLSTRVRWLHDLRERGYRVGPRAAVQTIQMSRRAGSGLQPVCIVGAPWTVTLDPAARIEVVPGSRLVLGGANQRVFDRPRGSFRLRADATCRVVGSARLGIGSNVRVGSGAVLTLGSSVLGAGCLLYCTSAIRIGDRCAIAWDVQFLDDDLHHVVGSDGESVNPPSPITVGDDVWIGFGATILKGVSIGDGAVIAARSVVTKDVPAGTLVAGNPADVVRREITWRD